MPSRRAVVVSWCELEPASGSVMPKAMMRRAVGEAGQPALLLLVGAEPGDDRAADRRGDDHHQQAAAGGAELLQDERRVRTMPPPPPPYSSGRLTPEEAELAGLAPQLVGAARRPWPAARCSRGRTAGRARRPPCAGRCCSSVSVKFTASISSPATDDGEHGADLDLLAGSDVSSVTTPSAGASITVLHLHRLQPEQRLAGVAPGRRAATASRTTVPGIGASSEPAAACSAGSRKRGTGRRATGPRAEST